MGSDRKRRYDRKHQVKERRRQESRKAKRSNRIHRLFVLSGILTIVGLVIGGFVLLGITSKTLPPTNFGPGHSESLPSQQINSQPIPFAIQEHVMEHVDSSGRPGVLVQYNCRKYDCEPGLVSTLTDIVRDFPPRVFLAPWPDMDAKIALAAPGRLETLETLDEDAVRRFIRRNLS